MDRSIEVNVRRFSVCFTLGFDKKISFLEKFDGFSYVIHFLAAARNRINWLTSANICFCSSRYSCFSCIMVRLLRYCGFSREQATIGFCGPCWI